jgi:radical SAM protein with 4Fe4S-binding SPASM domain
MESLTPDLHQDYSYYAFNKWLYHLDRVACVKKGDFREVMPVTAQLIPSLYCNFSCPRCSYGHSKEIIRVHGGRKAMQMDGFTMSTIIDRLSEAGIKGIIFTGGGEPTLNPHLIDGMRYATQNGIKIGLFTNGSLLTDIKIRKILELEPTFIRVSLDAGTSNIHRLLHGYSDKHNYLQRTLKNIEIMAKEKQIRNANTTIGVGVSVEPINLNDIMELAKRLREIVDYPPSGGIDYLVFRPTVNYECGGYFKTAQPILTYLKKQIPEYYEAYYNYVFEGKQLPTWLFEKANKIIDEEISRFLNGTGIEVINIRSKMLGITQPIRPFKKCRASPWYIFVGPDGTIYNCVELGLDPRVAVGNLLTQSLSEIWKSQQRQAVMDYIDERGLLSICPPVCLYYELNIIFEKLDEAFQADGQHHYEALKWIAENEARVEYEMESGLYRQHHREFL